MTIKSPNIRKIETIGYARRTYDYPNFSYIGWTPFTAFDLPLVYRADLENVDATHKERYTELQSKYRRSLQELDDHCERIRDLEQYISSHTVVSDDQCDIDT